MIGTIISAIIVGAIIGGLARLVMPGHQNISVLMTIVLGILGSAIGSWLCFQFGVDDNGGIKWIPLIVGVLVAAALIAGYMSLTRGRTRV